MSAIATGRGFAAVRLFVVAIVGSPHIKGNDGSTAPINTLESARVRTTLGSDRGRETLYKKNPAFRVKVPSYIDVQSDALNGQSNKSGPRSKGVIFINLPTARPTGQPSCSVHL